MACLLGSGTQFCHGLSVMSLWRYEVTWCFTSSKPSRCTKHNNYNSVCTSLVTTAVIWSVLWAQSTIYGYIRAKTTAETGNDSCGYKLRHNYWYFMNDCPFPWRHGLPLTSEGMIREAIS